MQLEQFHLEGLGHASYLVASDQTGDALVLDPQRDVTPYLDHVRRSGHRIRWVLDTHQHNDYLSGLTELVGRTGATALGSAHADRLGYDHRAVGDGDALELGEVGIEVLHTPGHTPEHVSLLLRDRDLDDDEPAILLSGGALLVGDLARPDLLGGEDETREAAERFCATIQDTILQLPDHVLVYPTHVAGSLCGGSIGSRLVTTVGYERRTNAVLSRVSGKDGFVRECLRLDNLPAVPPYWPRMRRQNVDGVATLGVVDAPPGLSVDEVAAAVDDGALVLDVRSPEAFATAHVPSALHVGAGSSFATWAGTVLPEGARVVLVLDDGVDPLDVTWDLLRVGYERPLGVLRGGMLAWRTSGRELASLATVDVHTLAARREEFHVLDVRQPDEWAAGHVDDAQFVTGAELPARLDEVPDDQPVAVVCGSGYRASVAASLLAHHGRADVANVLGGMAAWRRAGLPATS